MSLTTSVIISCLVFHFHANIDLTSKFARQDEEAGEGGWFWNEQVGSFRPPGALYCRECGVLVQDYDHL